jgi:hypothetical protein
VSSVPAAGYTVCRFVRARDFGASPRVLRDIYVPRDLCSRIRQAFDELRYPDSLRLL